MTPEQQAAAIDQAVEKLCALPEAMTLLVQALTANARANDKLADAIGNLAQSNENLVNFMGELIERDEDSDEEMDAAAARAAGRTLADED
jgi:hypothetical protein